MPPLSNTSNYNRNAHRWCTVIGKLGSTRLEGTPAMDLELQGIRTHVKTDKREIEVLVFCRYAATQLSPSSTVGTHTGGVQ